MEFNLSLDMLQYNYYY